MRKVVRVINALEEDMQALDDEALAAKSDEFRKRVEEGESLDRLLPEAFAVVREAGRRVMGMRHFDVQLIGGMTLHEGKIAISPTAPTTSSASTTCATTWPSRRRERGAARPVLRDRRRGGLDPDRRGAHAADHLRAVRGQPSSTRRSTDHPEADPRTRSPTRRASRTSAPATSPSTRRRAGLPERGGPREGRGACSPRWACSARARASTTPPTSC
jgi:hypothetical protein